MVTTVGRTRLAARRCRKEDSYDMADPGTDMMSTFALGHAQVSRSGYGAMQLAGPYAFGPPPDRASAIGVLRAAVAAGVDHIDTAQYYGAAPIGRRCTMARRSVSSGMRP